MDSALNSNLTPNLSDYQVGVFTTKYIPIELKDFMTTTEEHINDYQLPNVLKVEVGVIELPTRIQVDNLSGYETFTRNVTHLLALLPDEDKAAAEVSDDDTIIIHTENKAVLKYACNNYFLDDCLTTCHAVTDHLLSKFEGQVCEDCIDSYIDHALDNDYTSVVLSDGVFLKKGVVK